MVKLDITACCNAASLLIKANSGKSKDIIRFNRVRYIFLHPSVDSVETSSFKHAVLTLDYKTQTG